jgi:DNA-binding transcriptional LysR family regulator
MCFEACFHVAEATLAGAGTQFTGLLRVGIPFREGPHIMSRALTEVRRRFPDMELRLEATSDEEGPDAVHRDRLDLAIVSRYGNARQTARAGLREWTLGHDPLRLCIPADHPLAGAPNCEMTRLADEPWVLFPDTSLGRLVRSMCIAAGFQPRVAATVQDVGTAISLVGLGWGITIAPELTPAGTPAPVVRLPITGIDTIRYTALIVRDGEHLSPRMAAAISAVRSVSAELSTGNPVSWAPQPRSAATLTRAMVSGSRDERPATDRPGSRTARSSSASENGRFRSHSTTSWSWNASQARRSERRAALGCSTPTVSTSRSAARCCDCSTAERTSGSTPCPFATRPSARGFLEVAAGILEREGVQAVSTRSVAAAAGILLRRQAALPPQSACSGRRQPAGRGGRSAERQRQAHDALSPAAARPSHRGLRARPGLR